MSDERHRVQRAGSAYFLVQFASGCLPALQRAGRGSRFRPEADRARRRALDPRGRHRAARPLSQQSAVRRNGGFGAQVRLFDRRPDRVARRGSSRRRVVRCERTAAHRRPRAGRHGQLHGVVGRVGRLHRETAGGLLLRPGRQVERAVRRPQGVQRVRRIASEKGGPAIPHRRQEHRRAVGHEHRGAGPLDGGSRGPSLPEAAADRPGAAQGNSRAAALPARRRARLSVAQPQLALAVGRREPAYPARYADRIEARQRALHSRRAEHQASPARQRQADRQPEGFARRGQFGDRRRARRGYDASGRLDRRCRPARRRSRRRDRSRGTFVEGDGFGRHDGRLPVRPPSDRSPGRAP